MESAYDELCHRCTHPLNLFYCSRKRTLCSSSATYYYTEGGGAPTSRGLTLGMCWNSGVQAEEGRGTSGGWRFPELRTWNFGPSTSNPREACFTARNDDGATMSLHCDTNYGGAGMIKKLTKHGNSLALVLDRGVLDLLEIDADTPLNIKTDGRCLSEPLSDRV